MANAYRSSGAGEGCLCSVSRWGARVSLGVRDSPCLKTLWALLVTSYLLTSMGAAGEESRRVRVMLSADAHMRGGARSPRLEDWKEGALSLRVVDPGRLVVKA